MSKHSSKGQIIFNILLVVIFIVFITLATGYHGRAKVAPLVVAIPGLAVMLGLLVTDMRSRGKTASPESKTVSSPEKQATGAEDKKREIDTRSELISFAWAGLLFLFVYILGFAVAIPLYLFFFMKVKSKETLKFSLAFAGIASVVLYAFFMQLLKMQLYKGVLFQILS